MGCSADAGICFGIDCGEDRPFEDKNNDVELGVYLATNLGHDDPWDELPNPYMRDPEYSEWKEKNPGFDDRTSAWHSLKSKLEEESPVEIEFYNHYEYPLYIVALKGTKQRTLWGAEEFDPNVLDTLNQAEFERAIEFCEVNNLPDFSKATWLLYANYG